MNAHELIKEAERKEGNKRVLFGMFYPNLKIKDYDLNVIKKIKVFRR